MEMYPRKTVGFEEGWSSIKFGITKFNRILGGLHGPEFTSEEYMTLKTTIYNMCTQKPPNDYSQQLYEKYKEAFEEYINSSVLPSLREKQGDFMLRELMKGWDNHKAMVKWLSTTFSYLDRFFTVSKSLPKLNEVGFTCFRELVYQELKVKVRDAVITLIDQERGGAQIDLALLKNVVNLFVEIWDGQMDDYENFEDDMLKGFASYYTLKSSTWIDEDSCPDYMFKAEQCLKEERDRVSHYLRPSSEQKLLETMQQKLLVEPSTQLLDKHSACRGSLRDAQLEGHLSRMYRLFHEIPEGLKPIADIFEQHITAEGTALVQQAEDAPSVKVSVRKVMELHDKCMAYVKDCFANHSLFCEALNKAFQLLCNKKISGWSSAELLASFCDYILKKDGVEKLSDKEIEDTLDKVVELLAYIEDKDLFVEFYWKNLSRRLLSDENANDKHERLMLTKLKNVLFGLTRKMERMVTDLTLSKENQNHFEEYIGRNPNANPGINLTVSVITGGFWPSYICKRSDLYLPLEMVKCVTVFQEFFQGQRSLSYQGSLPLPKRRLSWIYSLGTCQINGNFEQKTIELTVETYQAAVLLLFNASDRLSYSEIQTQLNMADDVLVRVLKSLACAEYQILNKLPSNEKVTRGDHFEFNAKFTHRMSRIKIPLPPADEREGVVEEVTKDRRYILDALIVRIMKSRKVLHLQELVKQCVEQLRPTFKTDSKAIKIQIEKLMDRDYLERDKDNPELIHYLV